MTCIYDALYFVFFKLSNLNVEDSGGLGLGGNYGRRYGLVLYTWLTGMHLWRSGYNPFIRAAQYDYGRRLIVVPLTTFHRLSELIGDPKAEIVFLFNTARCGSTLLTQARPIFRDFSTPLRWGVNTPHILRTRPPTNLIW